MKEIEFPQWHFELPAKQHSQFSLLAAHFLPCLSLPSKSHCEKSISSIFLESPHQVDMKNVVKSSKNFFGISILQKLKVIPSTPSNDSSDMWMLATLSTLQRTFMITNITFIWLCSFMNLYSMFFQHWCVTDIFYLNLLRTFIMTNGAFKWFTH